MKTYTTQTRTHPIKQTNQNPLLSSYTGADGLKTGYINGYYNLIGTAKRDNIRLIAIVLGAKSPSERENDAIRLLNYGYTQYESITEGMQGEEVEKMTVFKSKSVLNTPAVLAKNISFVVHVKDKENIVVEDDLPPFVTGGKEKGDVVGERVVTIGDKTYKSDIILTEDIDEAGFVRSLLDTVNMVFTLVLDKVFGD